MKKLISTTLLSLALLTTFSLAQTLPPGTTIEAPKPKIIGFIYVGGCNKTFELYIFLDNTKIIHIDETTSPGVDVLKKTLEGVKGFNRQFDCGITA